MVAVSCPLVPCWSQGSSTEFINPPLMLIHYIRDLISFLAGGQLSTELLTKENILLDSPTRWAKFSRALALKAVVNVNAVLTTLNQTFLPISVTFEAMQNPSANFINH